jgi:hypothetical protein
VAYVLASIWCLAGLLIGDYVSNLFVPRELRPRWVSYLIIAQAVVPIFVVAAAGPLGRFRLFRWMLATPLPRATIDDHGMELCLPGRGCERHRWDEIGRLVPSVLSRRERWTSKVPVPRLDLQAPDGRLLASLPFSLAGPRARGLKSARTLAELVVERRPQRFALLRPSTLISAFLTFGLVGEAPPSWEIDSASRQRRTGFLLIILAILGLNVLAIAIVVLTKPR